MERRKQQRRDALAAQTADRNPLHFDVILRHQLRFQTAPSAQPNRLETALAQHPRHGQCGKHMAARTARHDQSHRFAQDCVHAARSRFGSAERPDMLAS